MRPTRSASDSPKPKMPPEQTLIPASLTASIVSSLSSYERVVMTYTCSASELGSKNKSAIPWGKILATCQDCGYMLSNPCDEVPGALRREVNRGMRCHSRLLELTRLFGRQHSKSGTDFHSHTADLADHGENPLEPPLATGQIPPCSTHTESGASVFLCFPGCLKDRFDVNQSRSLGRGRVPRRLRAIGTLMFE